MNDPVLKPREESIAEHASSPRCVAILLATYNGEKFLVEQLESLLAQTHRNWVIYASDDGSSDATLEILHLYQKRLGKDRLFILSGPCQGFSKNFMSLVKSSLVKEEYVAFCDQDDVWLPKKLENGLAFLSGVAVEAPALYCSRTHLIDEKGTSIGFSPLFRRPPNFENALVQSIAGANTMLLNKAALELLRLTDDRTAIISHDWWAYILVTGCSGKVFFDAEPSILYRQHGSNLIGSNSSASDRLVRVREMLKGTFKYWNDSNLDAIKAAAVSLSDSSGNTISCFEEARRSSLFRGIYLLLKSGVYRQTMVGNIGLFVALIIKKV